MLPGSPGDRWLYEWGYDKVSYTAECKLSFLGALSNITAAEEAKEEGIDQSIPLSLCSGPQSKSSTYCGEKERRMWSLVDFDIGRKLGEGRFGKIYLAREKQTKCAVVLKCLSKEMIRYHNLKHQLRREIELQEYAGRCNSHILRLFAYFWDDLRVVLVLEYADGGNLQTLLDSRPYHRLQEEEVRCILQQVLFALQFLHDRDIIHRDVKPENILFKGKGKRKEVKLADFSWAVRLNYKVPQYSRRHTLCGTIDYLAPEQVLKRGCTTKADMWALGILAYRMLCGNVPFEDLPTWEMYSRITKGDVRYPSHLSNKARSLIEALLCVDEDKRFSAYEALQHIFFSCNGGDATTNCAQTGIDNLVTCDPQEARLARQPMSNDLKVTTALTSASLADAHGQRVKVWQQPHDGGNNESVVCMGSSAANSCASFVTVSSSHPADCALSPLNPSTSSFTPFSAAARGECAPSAPVVAAGVTCKSFFENALSSSQGPSYSRSRKHCEANERSVAATTHNYTQLDCSSSSSSSPVVFGGSVNDDSNQYDDDDLEETVCAIQLRFDDSQTCFSQLTALSSSAMSVDNSG